MTDTEHRVTRLEHQVLELAVKIERLEQALGSLVKELAKKLARDDMAKPRDQTCVTGTTRG